MTLNLLSPAAKEQRRSERLFRHIMFTGELTFILFAVLSVLLAAEIWYAYSKLAEIHGDQAALSLNSRANELADMQQSLRRIKDSTDALTRIEQTRLNTYSLMREVFDSVNAPEVYLTEFTLDAQHASASLSGIADSRASLLVFKEHLEALPRFSGVNLPLANLLKERDIPFSFSMTLVSQ